jgi:hypothetical protein
MLQASYWAKMPKAAAYCELLRQEARKTGYSSTHFGRRRYIPEINSSNKWERLQAERYAVNTPVQGTAADLVKFAIARVDKALEAFKSRLMLTVHDQLTIAHHPDDNLDDLGEAMREAMEMDNMFGWEVPLLTEAGYGPNWNDIDDYTYPSRRTLASYIDVPVDVVARLAGDPQPPGDEPAPGLPDQPVAVAAPDELPPSPGGTGDLPDRPDPGLPAPVPEMATLGGPDPVRLTLTPIGSGTSSYEASRTQMRQRMLQGRGRDEVVVSPDAGGSPVPGSVLEGGGDVAAPRTGQFISSQDSLQASPPPTPLDDYLKLFLAVTGVETKIHALRTILTLNKGEVPVILSVEGREKPIPYQVSVSPGLLMELRKVGVTFDLGQQTKARFRTQLAAS